MEGKRWRASALRPIFYADKAESLMPEHRQGKQAVGGFRWCWQRRVW
jgi:hypothetical protein